MFLRRLYFEGYNKVGYFLYIGLILVIVWWNIKIAISFAASAFLIKPWSCGRIYKCFIFPQPRFS